MFHTSYSHLTNDELVQLKDTKSSDLGFISELCKRIEAIPDECPHCEEELVYDTVYQTMKG